MRQTRLEIAVLNKTRSASSCGERSMLWTPKRTKVAVMAATRKITDLQNREQLTKHHP